LVNFQFQGNRFLLSFHLTRRFSITSSKVDIKQLSVEFGFVDLITCGLCFVEILKLNIGESSRFTSIEINWNMNITNMTMLGKMSFDFIRPHGFINRTNV